MAGKYGATLHLLYAVREMQLPPELKKMAEVEKNRRRLLGRARFRRPKILGDAHSRATPGSLE